MKISRNTVLTLPLPLRVAWGISIVERVLKLYSTYFITKYHQKLSVEYAWSWALGETEDSDKRKEIIDLICSYIDEADSEGYGFNVMTMGTEVLYEIDNQDGKSINAAIENAAFGYACQQLYKQGFAANDPRIPTEYEDSLKNIVFNTASEAFNIAVSWGKKPIERNMFASVILDFVLIPIKPEKILKRRVTLQPPPHER